MATAKQYDYQKSESGRYVLSLDGREVARGTEGELWRYLHRHCSCSVSHALAHEGYSIEPEEQRS